MLFRGGTGHRLEPMREVRRTVFLRPALHRMRDGVGGVAVK